MNRKEKSLGLLAERMLAGLPENVTSGESMELQLDDTARLLQTERRRIYDIVNVYKSIGLVRNINLTGKKSGFEWMGTDRLLQIVESKHGSIPEDPLLVKQ